MSREAYAAEVRSIQQRVQAEQAAAANRYFQEALSRAQAAEAAMSQAAGRLGVRAAPKCVIGSDLRAACERMMRSQPGYRHIFSSGA